MYYILIETFLLAFFSVSGKQQYCIWYMVKVADVTGSVQFAILSYKLS